MLKRIAALGAGIATVAALAGCGVSISGQRGAQQDVIGPLVRLTTTLCSNANSSGSSGSTGEPTDGSDCAPDSSNNSGGVVSDGEYLLLSYRVPDDVTGPATATLTDDAGTAYTLTRDDELAAQQEALTPTADGTHWDAYRSAMFDPTGTDVKRYTATADFRLPATAAGDRYRDGTFPYSVRKGERVDYDFTNVQGAPPITSTSADPTSCIEIFQNQGVLVTAAMRSRPLTTRTLRRAARQWRSAKARRTARSLRGHARQAQQPPPPNAVCDGSDVTPAAVDLRNLAVLPGGGATAVQGSTVDVPFNVKFTGKASPEASFALSVAGVPGASVAPSYAPATDSTAPVSATVAVPDDLAPGTYDVALTATKGGQTRTGTTQLTVTAKPAAVVLPPLTETLDELTQTTLSQVQTSGQPATVGCNVDCTATVDLLLYKPPADRVGISAAARYRAVPTVLLGRVKVPVAGGAKQTVTVPVRDNAMEKLGNLGKFTLVVRTTATDGRGQATPALVRKVRLKPGCGGRPSCVPRR